MKILPRTRPVVIAAVGLACVVTIVVFAQPTPTAKLQPQFQLTMCHSDGKKADLDKALQQPASDPLINHKDRFKLSCNDADVGGGMAMVNSQDCNIGTHFTSNITQTAAFMNSTEMANFLKTAFPGSGSAAKR